MPGLATLIHRLLSVPGAGCLGVTTTTDWLSADLGDPLLVGCLAPPPCSYPAAAFRARTLGVACIVTVCLPPTDGMCGMVPYAPCTVHPMPSTWLSHRLAHASGLQWPSFLGTPPIDDHLRGVFAYPGQPSTPHGAHHQAAHPLCGLPTGTPCLVAGHTTFSHAWPPSSCHQGLGCYLSHGAPP